MKTLQTVTFLCIGFNEVKWDCWVFLFIYGTPTSFSNLTCAISAYYHWFYSSWALAFRRTRVLCWQIGNILKKMVILSIVYDEKCFTYNAVCWCGDGSVVFIFHVQRCVWFGRKSSNDFMISSSDISWWLYLQNQINK